MTLFQVFTMDQYFDLIEETAIVMGYFTSCLYVLTWILLGSFIFRNIFVGVMVNNFQNIRQSIIAAGGDDARNNADNLDIFKLDQL